MYRKILIANRADCALRLIRACHDMGIQTVCIAARDDCLKAVQAQADEIVFTGMSRDAYTNEDDILEAARQTGCEAILPGWGFLSESFAFARRCRLMGIHFIGPTSEQLQCFGDKWTTIEKLADVTGYSHAAIRCDDSIGMAALERAPFTPCMLKWRFGGGGKCIELCNHRLDLHNAIERIEKTQFLSSYYMEPAIAGASHVEFQCFGDGCGNVEILGFRDCTPQVRNQKWLEISIDPNDYPDLQRIAQKLTRRLGEMRYLGWGTVEFLVEPNGRAHLLELNPRLQVEHGVTEMSRGIDMLRNAIALSCSRKHSEWDWHPWREAVEFRLYANNTGLIENMGFEGYEWPLFPVPDHCECRVESAYRTGDVLNGIYDGMTARFILSTDKGMACGKLKEWLRTFKLEGIEHNLSDLYDFDAGNFPTKYGKSNV
ncbi:MAG: hypothetical protein J6A01_00235 [Proteobacteria bacterium]|nr:hypothetical protein [Pseudomonadota bacterium]